MRRAMAWLAATVVAAPAAGRAQDAVDPAAARPSAVAVPPISLVEPAYLPYLTPVPVPTTPSAQPPAGPFAQRTEAGGQAGRTFNENFDGDFPGLFYSRSVVTGFTTVPRVAGFTPRVTGNTTVVTVGPNGQRVVTQVPVVVNDPVIVQDRVAVRQTVRVPLAGRYNGVSVVENGNPLPVDQAFVGYNFYSNAGGGLNPGLGGSDVQRQLAGFESSLPGGNTSIGLRLPFLQQYGPVGLGAQQVGDLTVLVKYAGLYDRQTGNGLTGGLAFTAPTGGGGTTLADGSSAPHSWLFQPFGGFVRRFDRGYVQGIINLIAPSDGRDVTLLGNHLAVGYWLYQAPANRLLTGITPTAEVHVWTPLDHRSPTGSVYLPDMVNLTGGLHFRFNRAVISGAVVVPVTGPRPFDVEAITYATYWF